MDRTTTLTELKAGGDAACRAARRLGRWNDTEVVDALLRALDSDDRALRAAAADTLLLIMDVDTVRKLVPLLGSGRPTTCTAALALLQRLSKVAPEILIGLAADPDAPMRALAANVAGESRNRDLAAPLLGLLSDPDAVVRNAAVIALGRLGAPEAVRGLERVAVADTAWLRVSAIDALRKVATTEAVRALLRLLERAPAELLDPLHEALRSLPDLGLDRDIREGLARRTGPGKGVAHGA
jgi:HEAT repeat protein